MTIFGWVLLIVLSIIIISLVFILFYIVKKASYYNNNDKELIKFVIDMYIEYGEEINITSKDKHDVLVKKLNEIKEKL